MWLRRFILILVSPFLRQPFPHCTFFFAFVLFYPMNVRHASPHRKAIVCSFAAVSLYILKVGGCGKGCPFILGLRTAGGQINDLDVCGRPKAK